MDAKESSEPRELRGRGTALNPPDRFSEIAFTADPEDSGPETPHPATRLFRDSSKSILARNDSPDIPFDVSINPYRGCEHGCIYCYARPTHEYLGFSAGLDFETRILVKENAHELLRAELRKKNWRRQWIAMSGVTDCYQPIERTLKITRRCLEVLVEFEIPVGVITKSSLVARDIDLLTELARKDAAKVCITITTLDSELAGKLEPRAARPAKRLETIKLLSNAGIPVAVLVAPVIPGLTDHEIPKILEAGANAGARSAGWQMLRLPLGVKDLFDQWLQDVVPDRRSRVLSRIRDMRAGMLNDSQFGRRMRGEGAYASQVASLFRIASRRYFRASELATEPGSDCQDSGSSSGQSFGQSSGPFRSSGESC